MFFSKASVDGRSRVDNDDRSHLAVSTQAVKGSVLKERFNLVKSANRVEKVLTLVPVSLNDDIIGLLIVTIVKCERSQGEVMLVIKLEADWQLKVVLIKPGAKAIEQGLLFRAELDSIVDATVVAPIVFV